MAFDVDLTKRIGTVDIALRIEAGEGLTVLFGQSGIGKTSVLNMIAGLLKPDWGYVHVGGEVLFDDHTNLPPNKRNVGYVFQEPRLFPHMRVAANLRYGAPRGTPIEPIAGMLEIEHLLDRWPQTLSGGEAKRVAIARALLSEPAFLLLDEPTASLDRSRADEVERAIRDVRDELGLPILMVTHDRAEAERLATRIVEMTR